MRDEGEQNLGHGPELPLGSVPISTERGSRRFPWKSFLLGLGLTAAGGVTGSLIFGIWDVQTPINTLRALGVGAVTAVGMGSSFILTGGLNIFREDVNYLFGRGELHSKSPALHSR